MEEALKAAAQIAKRNDFEIIILHMLELPYQMNFAIYGRCKHTRNNDLHEKVNEILK